MSAELKKILGEGGSLLDGMSANNLREVLASIIADMGAKTVTPAWATAIAVAVHTATLPNPGMVVAVDGDTGAATGGKVLVNAAPAAGECQVVYNAAGVPTLNFNAADAITQCAVQQLPHSALGTTVES